MVCASVHVCVNAGDTHRMSTSVSCVGYVCACVCVRGMVNVCLRQTCVRACVYTLCWVCVFVGRMWCVAWVGCT